MNATIAGAMPTLRVASVYSASPHNLLWHALQQDFLRRNTLGVDFQFGVFLNGIEADALGMDTEIIGRSPDNIGHAAGLQQVLEHFRANATRADGYLLLDSDCFPVHPNWLAALRGLMSHHGKRYAAPIRFENLEPYPHPCALFMEGDAIDDPRLLFDATALTQNLLGAPTRDIGAGLQAIREDLLPLLRSNVRNPHPIAAAVYSHLFYHHGAGSRAFSFRAIDKHDYYAPLQAFAPPAKADALLQELISDPHAFITSLMRG